MYVNIYLDLLHIHYLNCSILYPFYQFVMHIYVCLLFLIFAFVFVLFCFAFLIFSFIRFQ